MLIAGATVLTVNERDDVLAQGWVRVRNGVIENVSAAPLNAVDGEEVIDARGHIVMPGLVNTHTHLFQTLLRGVYEERPLATYLDYIYRSGVELTREDCRVSAVLGSIEAIRAGTTTIADHHFLNRVPELAEGTIDGMLAAGVRGVLARTVMDMGDGLPAEILERPAEGLRAVAALLDRYKTECGSGMLTIMTGPNTPGMNASADAVVATSNFARAHGIRRSAHVAEYRGVTDSVRRHYGVEGVITWLASLNALGPDLLAVHAVQVRPDEVSELARSGACVSHNPFSNLFCGDRNAPVSDYLRHGITVGLGTDGGANNNAQGVLDALRITRLLQRANVRDPMAISPEQGIRMATIDGARALGLESLTGSLEPGKRADIVIIECEQAPHTVPTHDAVVQLVHSIKGTDVRSTIVDGRFVMRDRHIVTVNETSALRAAAEAARNLVRRLG
jgi:5-methylthioadenosine/S-adenosylhomocysteine deaminase